MMMHNRSNVVSLKQLRQMFSKYLLEKETEGTLGCIVHAIKKKKSHCHDVQKTTFNINYSNDSNLYVLIMY